MGKTVIDVWVADLTFPGYMDRLWRLAEAFERAHPEYEVSVQGRDFRTLPAEISRAAAAGHTPAIAEYYFYLTPVARDLLAVDGSPLFTSVQAAIGGRDEILGEPVVLDDLLPAVREYYTYPHTTAADGTPTGDLTSMPTVATTMLLYANTTALRAAGIAEPPRTWAEIDAVCQAVTRPQSTDGPAAHGGITWANHGLFFQQALAVQGGLLADNANGRAGRASAVRLDSPEMLAWVRWWRRLHRAGHYVYTGKIPDWEGTFRAFAEQRVPLRLTSSNDLHYMTQAADSGGFDLAVTRFPYRDDVPYGGNAVAGTSLWLANGLDEATSDGALAFMQFVNNPRNAADRHKDNSFIPVTRSAAALLEEEGWFDRHPHHRVASEQLATYPPAPGSSDAVPPIFGALFGDFAGVQDVMTRAMHDVLTADADPVARFAEANIEANNLLDGYEADRARGGPSGPNSVRVEYFRDAQAYSGADLENVVRLNR